MECQIEHVCKFRPYLGDRDDDLCGTGGDTNIYTVAEDGKQVKVVIYGFFGTRLSPADARTLARALNKAAKAAEGRTNG